MPGIALLKDDTVRKFWELRSLLNAGLYENI
jgi:hypothetical protein